MHEFIAPEKVFSGDKRFYANCMVQKRNCFHKVIKIHDHDGFRCDLEIVSKYNEMFQRNAESEV